MDNFDKWVAGLRSGKYQQAKSKLKNTHGDGIAMCCLGVACDISGRGAWEDEDYLIIGEERVYRADDNMPFAVADWLGINTRYIIKDSGEGSLSTYIPFDHEAVQYPNEALRESVLEWKKGRPTTLVSLDILNDTCNWNFNEIADFLELNKEYFLSKTYNVSERTYNTSKLKEFLQKS